MSDINGVSAKAIIQGLVEGKCLQALLDCTRGRLKVKKPDLAKALNCPLGTRHRVLLQHIQNHIDYLEKQLQQIDDELFAGMAPYKPQWELLQTIPGIDMTSAAIIIVVLGVDMTC